MEGCVHTHAAGLGNARPPTRASDASSVAVDTGQDVRGAAAGAPAPVAPAEVAPVPVAPAPVAPAAGPAAGGALVDEAAASVAPDCAGWAASPAVAPCGRGARAALDTGAGGLGSYLSPHPEIASDPRIAAEATHRASLGRAAQDLPGTPQRRVAVRVSMIW